MKVARLVVILIGIAAAVTVVPLYDNAHPVQDIKDEVKALRSIFPMRHPENKSIVVQVGKHRAKKAKPRKIGAYVLKVNHLNPKDL